MNGGGSVTKIVSIHSFRGGTGKSNTSANLAAQVAATGKRVAVIDTDIQSPGVHVLYGFHDDTPSPALNDYLWGKCEISDTAHDVTRSVNGAAVAESSLSLVPSSVKPSDIARILREGYDVEALNEGFRSLSNDLQLDMLVIDTHPGLNEETLLSITISDTLILLMRPDKQDYQGTAVTVDIARRLAVPELLILVNKVPSGADRATLVADIEHIYAAEVAGVLPLSEDVAVNASAGLFSVTQPDHPWSQEIRKVAARLDV